MFYRSGHPYTEGLLLSVPKVEGELGPLRPIGGQPPSVIDLPPGCAFHPRCRYARLDGVCTQEVPPLAGVSAHAKGGYYHDGRFADLDAVVAHYDSTLSLSLTDAQKQDLVEFLKSI